ncbi:MAG: glycosyltransferase, partial [Armatimonadota bacterium]
MPRGCDRAIDCSRRSAAGGADPPADHGSPRPPSTGVSGEALPEVRPPDRAVGRLEHASGVVAISMGADLQHAPELISGLLEKWREGYAVVIAVREPTGDEGWGRRASSRAFYRLLN